MSNVQQSSSDASVSTVPVPGKGGALETAPFRPSVEQLENFLRLATAAKQFEATRAEQEALHEPATAVDKEASVGKPRVARGDNICTIDQETSPVAQVTDNRQLDSYLGQQHFSPEPLTAISTLPTETALLELGLQMLTGGSGAPAAPDVHFQPAEATLGLLDLIWIVAKKLKKEHASEIHIVPGTNGRIDQEEIRGFLLGAVLGRGLLERKQAAAAGLDARNKRAAIEKRLGAEKEAARKAARKLSGDALERHHTATADARAALEGAVIPLELPPPLMPPPPPEPQSAAGRKRAAETDSRVEAWCQRHGRDVTTYGRGWEKRRFERANQERKWRPRGSIERAELAQTLATQRRNNQCCSCDDGMPSFLCQVHVCWALEVGTCDGLEGAYGPVPGPIRPPPSPLVNCSCMRFAWDVGDEQDRWPVHKPMLLADRNRHYYDDGTVSLPFKWLDPPPGGAYGPDFCPVAAARQLTSEEHRRWVPQQPSHRHLIGR